MEPHYTVWFVMTASILIAWRCWLGTPGEPSATWDVSYSARHLGWCLPPTECHHRGQWLWNLLVPQPQEFLTQIVRRLTEVTNNPRETASNGCRSPSNDSMRPIHNLRVHTVSFPDVFYVINLLATTLQLNQPASHKRCRLPRLATSSSLDNEIQLKFFLSRSDPPAVMSSVSAALSLTLWDQSASRGVPVYFPAFADTCCAYPLTGSKYGRYRGISAPSSLIWDPHLWHQTPTSNFSPHYFQQFIMKLYLDIFQLPV